MQHDAIDGIVDLRGTPRHADRFGDEFANLDVQVRGILGHDNSPHVAFKASRQLGGVVIIVGCSLVLGLLPLGRARDVQPLTGEESAL